MTNDQELRALISAARSRGVLVEVVHDQHASLAKGRDVIDMVRVAGVPGVGHHPMPAIAAAEALRQLVSSNVRNMLEVQ